MTRMTGVQSQVKSYQRLEMILDAFSLYIQDYKLGIKVKGLFRKRTSALPLHLDVVAIEKGAFRSPSTTVANFTFI